MKILVVDDSMSARHLMTDSLKQLGYSGIETADNGATALKKVLAGKFDLIIADWNMPTMNGIELLRAIRGNPEISNIKFLMVTSEAKEENVHTAIDAGINNYIVKPFSVGTLEEKIAHIFKS